MDQRENNENDNTRGFSGSKSVFHMNPLLCMIVITVILMYAYGMIIAEHGYNNPMVQGFGDKLVLAVLGFREEVYPWSEIPTMLILDEEDDFPVPAEDPGQMILVGVENTSQLAAAGFAVTEDFSGYIYHSRRQPKELERGPGNHSFSEQYVEYHLALVNNPEPDAIQIEDYLPSAPPEFITVDETYFADAAFIGDSRMVGVGEYANIGDADFLAKISMTIYNMMDAKISLDGKNLTVREALTDNHYGKIYLMVGINEIGTADVPYFIRAYTAVIDEIRQLQPDAIIIVQAIMHVTGELSRNDEYYNNENINARNEALKELANGVDIFYIDVNEVYDDENGNLRQDLSFDNVHLLGNCYGLWHDFYMEHGIVTDSAE